MPSDVAAKFNDALGEYLPLLAARLEDGGDMYQAVAGGLRDLEQGSLSWAQLNQILHRASEAGMSEGFFRYYFLEVPDQHPYPVDRVFDSNGYSLPKGAPFEGRSPLARATAPAAEIIRQQLIGEGLRELPTDSEALITHRQRSAFSTDFASKTLRTFDTFAGDLSWLQRDLPTYRALRGRHVCLRFLTDTPNAPIIREAKRLGMLFREYPVGTDARIKASIADADVESDARALVVQKRRLTSRSDVRRGPYDYRMKVYQGPREYSVIAALSSYFEDLFSRGRVL